VPGYQLLGELGRGGMGVVYKAVQLRLNRTVALKMILAGSHAGAAELARFRTEGEAIARLQHPNIVQVYEVGQHEGKPFFSLEFCGGGTLERKFAGQALPPREAAALVEALAGAVQHAHEHHIVHRDLKPANVLLTEDGTPKITDFGLAKLVDAAGSQTCTGAVMGTPSYMAPEQADGKGRPVGPAADVYALGVILYELLTGQPPFRAPTALDVLFQIVAEEPPPPRELRPEIGRDLEAVCLKCLEKEPARRYASARELADDLRRFRDGEPVQARPLGPAGRLARWAQQRPALAGTLCALGLLYAAHLLMMGLGLVTEWGFHWFVTALLAGWASGAVAFQWLAGKPGLRWPATYAWAAFDVLMFTALLLRAEGPHSALLVCYLLLVAAAALRFRVSLVWLVSGLCQVSYALLLADTHWRPSRAKLAVPPYQAVIFLLSLVLMAVAMTLLLRRFRLALAQER
jgi:hypothetical protein